MQTATGNALKRSSDRKVQPARGLRNSIGLPAGSSCPGRTETCKSCYAEKIEKRFRGVSAVCEHNFALLRDARAAERLRLLNAMLTEYAAECARRPELRAPYPFRWHWNGDVFDLRYARAIAKAMLEHPEIQGWIYTRTVEAVAPLLHAPNLTVYFSVDAFNIEAAKTLTHLARLRFAATGSTWLETRALLDLLGRTRSAPKCPELTGALELQGACIKCGLCVEGRSDIRFSTDNKTRKSSAPILA